MRRGPTGCGKRASRRVSTRQTGVSAPPQSLWRRLSACRLGTHAEAGLRFFSSLPVILLIAALAHLGCGRKKPPLSPRDARASFQLPADLRIELVASEPQISDPVAMSFDERGRLYVVEMPDYPLNPNALGRIKLLEDRDGDGRYERTTIFAEGLHFPEG